MKIKMNVYITDPEHFAKDPQSNCYTLMKGRHMDSSGWVFAGEVEFEIVADRDEVIKTAKKELDERIGVAAALINALENRKADLLALPEPE